MAHADEPESRLDIGTCSNLVGQKPVTGQVRSSWIRSASTALAGPGALYRRRPGSGRRRSQRDQRTPYPGVIAAGHPP